MSYIHCAFDEVCKEANVAKAYYVSLMASVPYYGGPEEGGWWGNNQIVVKYQRFDTEEAAETAMNAVEELAKNLSEETKKEFGKQCLREMAICDKLNVDYDFLPEIDGEETYYVVMTEELPVNSYGCRQYS